MQGAAPTTVLVGQSYSFQPTASDADGDALQFTAANVPGWLSFNAQTGAMTGTPASANLGTYNNISITVSDGKTSTVLGPFSITVADSASGSATISWTAPLQNTDGTPLSNLSGYRLLYGKAPSELNQTIAIDNPSLSSYVVPNLTAGIWYFAVVSVNSSGVESSPSNVATKTVS